MIHFNVDETGVYVNKSGIEEFKENLMTTTEIVDAILSYNNSKRNSKLAPCKETMEIQKRMLTRFFNDPNSYYYHMDKELFYGLSIGWGFSSDVDIIPIIMWEDDNNVINFATYDENKLNLMKVQMVDGDVWSASYDDVKQYYYDNYTDKVRDCEAEDECEYYDTCCDDCDCCPFNYICHEEDLDNEEIEDEVDEEYEAELQAKTDIYKSLKADKEAARKELQDAATKYLKVKWHELSAKAELMKVKYQER